MALGFSGLLPAFDRPRSGSIRFLSMPRMPAGFRFRPQRCVMFICFGLRQGLSRNHSAARPVPPVRTWRGFGTGDEGRSHPGCDCRSRGTLGLDRRLCIHHRGPLGPPLRRTGTRRADQSPHCREARDARQRWWLIAQRRRESAAHCRSPRPAARRRDKHWSSGTRTSSRAGRRHRPMRSKRSTTCSNASSMRWSCRARRRGGAARVPGGPGRRCVARRPRREGAGARGPFTSRVL